MKKNIFNILTLFVIAITLTGCQSKQDPVETEHLQKIRLELVKETAISYASKYALYWQAKHINQHLEKHSRSLDDIFNFRALLLEHQLLPPILIESSNNINADSPFVIRANDKMIRLIRPATLVTTAPTWRQFIHMAYQEPEKPLAQLLPKNKKELEAWQEGLHEGWKAGTEQAGNIFRTHMGYLKRDYLGMVLYYKLLAQKMISPSHAAIADLGITGDDMGMSLNDRLIKVTQNSKLLPKDVSLWQPALMTKTQSQ